MRWYERLTRIDRRVIYALLTLFVILPFFVPLRIPQNIMPQTQRLFDFIDSIPAGDRAVIVSFDYTPQTQPECHPMALAILHHCFARRVPVIGVSFDPQGPGLAVAAFAEAVADHNAHLRAPADSLRYGIDYLYLGWKSGRVAALLEMGEQITAVFPQDHFRNSTEPFPLLQRVRNYKGVALAIVIAAAAYPDDWILYPGARYGVKVSAGLTAVMVPEYYPYLQTGQLVGIIAGMKGAAEYEHLVYDHGYSASLGRAETGMNSQSTIHLLLIVLIVLGNIGYLAARRRP